MCKMPVGSIPLTRTTTIAAPTFTTMSMCPPRFRREVRHGEGIYFTAPAGQAVALCKASLSSAGGRRYGRAGGKRPHLWYPVALTGPAKRGTGGVNAENVNDYLGYDQIFAVGGTWMCKSDVIKAGDWAKITAQSKEAVDTMLGLHLIHVGINTGNEEEAAKIAGLISTMLNMKVTPGNSSIFVGNKEFEIMKKPGRGTNGHIAIGCNNVDRAIYHLSQRGVKFDLDSKNVKNGKTVACYMEGEIAGFAFHLVQA